MKGLFWILLCAVSVTAHAAELSREARIKKRVQLRVAVQQVDFCEKELGKLKYDDETPFFFNQNYPAATNSRFAQNKLTPDEKIAYTEFTAHCEAITAEMNKLTEELREKK